MVILDLIASWWHWVYMDLMGGSVMLMWLFGWEVFLTAIVVVTVWSYAMVVAVGQIVLGRRE